MYQSGAEGAGKESPKHTNIPPKSKKNSPKKKLLTGGAKIRRKSKVKKQFSKDTIKIKNR